MTKRSLAAIIAIIIIILIGAWLYMRPSSQAATAPTGTSTRSLITAVTYACDAGKTITAAYYDGPAAAQPAPGQPPVPTGSADVSIGGAPTTTLAQTISADGIRYANADESLVFWSKGNTALVMRNNSMDLSYTNCTDTSSPAAPSDASTTATTTAGVMLPPAGPITVSGTMVCLPHADTTGAQTAECAIGIKSDSGRYFALSSSDPMTVGSIASGTHVTVTGTLTLRTDSQYQDVGVIAVSKISK